MAVTFTNTKNIPLALAVWLLHDEYDYVDKENYFSATGLMKPIRHIIIPPRLNNSSLVDRTIDLDDLIARALGNSVHHSIEKAWLHNRAKALSLLGYPESVIERVLLNPTPEELKAVEDPIPVYLEQRAFREITVDGVTYTIGGKYDMVTEGYVNDTKSTSAWGWMFGTRDEEHQLQGSIYRWIDEAQDHPVITEDFMQVNYIFTDWQKAMARSKEDYPDSRLKEKKINLLTSQQTEDFIREKIAYVRKHINTPESELPFCTDEELWRSDPVYKYYADPNKTSGRSTRNFKDAVEAAKFKAEKGKGVVITVPGEVKRCSYCDAFDGCTQKDKYL